MKKLEELKQEIIKAVPEIMELKFGCKIKEDDEVYTIIGENDGGYYVAFDNKKLFRAEIGTVDDEDILGRDITLEDVLIAIDKTEFKPTRELIVVKMRVANIVLSLLDIYELGKPLHEQSVETINSLNEILVKH